MKNSPNQCGLLLITYAPSRRGGGVKPPIHFYCVLHAKRGEGVQIACNIAYVINGRTHIHYIGLCNVHLGNAVDSLYVG